MPWTRPSATGQGPAPRCAHTSNFHHGRIIVFGGWNGQRMLNDVYVFNIDTLRWTKQSTTGTGPSARAGHSAVVIASKLVVFGGGDGSNYLNDLWILDLETMAWEQGFTTGTTPCARSRHTASVAGGSRMVVFGGGDDSRVYNDVYVLSAASMTWSKPAVSGTAMPPSPRWGHSAVAVADGHRIIVCGGHDGTNMLNDVFALDVDSFSWSLLIPATPAPSSPSKPGSKSSDSQATAPSSLPSSASSAPASGKDPQLEELPPSPRAGHTMNAVGDLIMLFGGGDGEKVLNDLFFLEPTAQGSYRWLHPLTSTTAPTGRCAHTATVAAEEGAPTERSTTVFVFGGGDGSRRFKDVHMLNPSLVLRGKASSSSSATTPSSAPAATTAQASSHPPAVHPPPSSCPAIIPGAAAPSAQQCGPASAQAPLTPAAAAPTAATVPPTSSHGIHSSASTPGRRAPAPPALRVRDPIHNTDVGAFLHTLGLDGHAAAFLREDITPETMPMLSERHLEAMGINALGVRLRILGAIRKTYGHVSLSTSQVTQPAAAAASPSPASSGLTTSAPNSPKLSTAERDHHISSALLTATERLEHTTAALTEAVTALTAAISRQQQHMMPQIALPPVLSEPFILSPYPVSPLTVESPQLQQPQPQPQQPQPQPQPPHAPAPAPSSAPATATATAIGKPVKPPAKQQSKEWKEQKTPGGTLQDSKPVMHLPMPNPLATYLPQPKHASPVQQKDD